MARYQGFPTKFYLTREQLRALREIRDVHGILMAALVREGIDQVLARYAHVIEAPEPPAGVRLDRETGRPA